MISIITVCRNDSNNLRKTIDSLQGQVDQRFEFIVIDGASTDNTGEIVETNRDRIDVYISERDTGIYDAMNKGITHSRGEYLLFLNAGERLESRNSTSILNTILDTYASDLFKFGYVFNGEVRYERLSRLFLFRRMFNHQTMVYARTCFDEYRFDPHYRIAGDYAHLLKILPRLKINYIDIPLVEYLGGGVAAGREILYVTWNERCLGILRARGLGVLKVPLLIFSFILSTVRRVYR